MGVEPIFVWISMSRPITGAHLVFYDSMLASFEGRQLEFNRGIRIGVKPVEGWDSV